jgi:hypothetical protein
MLDVKTLDHLSLGGSFSSASARRPPALSDFFEWVVESGWAPQNPCTDERELARLEQSTVRGDCISPLLQAGDTVFIDRAAAPLPGDVVSFRLSRRFCAAQNSDLPAGQSPWEPGAPWCKLYGRFHGLDMLFDRHGGSVTATLATLEDPDGAPLPHLHPVRNVRRNGRLLFAPDAYSGQIGLNAATDPASSVNTSSSVMGSVLTYVSVTVTVPTGQTWPVLVTGSANANLGASPTGAFRLKQVGTIIQGPYGWNSNMANGGFTAAFDCTTTLAAGSHTFTIEGFNSSGGATFEGAGLTVSLLKR